MITAKFLFTCICLGICIGLVLIALIFAFQLFVTWIFSFGKCRCKNPQLNYKYNSKMQLVCKDCGGKAN